MKKADSSSLEEKSRGTSALLLSPEDINNWRNAGPDIRTGTACKCGTHTSAKWTEGGMEWFEGHVLENHVDERKKLMGYFAGIVQNTPMPASGKLEDFRKALVERILGGNEETETLADA